MGNVAVRIEIGSATHDVIADRGGVIDSRIPVALTPGWHTARLTTAGADSVTALVRVVSAEPGIGIISDVDDTIMVTALPRPFLAFWNTFVLDEHARSPTPGMAVLYERLMRAHPEALIVYLSTGAWNVAPTLDRFLNRNLYPPGPLLLTDWGPTHDRWFRSGREHKMENLRRLCEEFPHIRWLLIGDDGQHDEEIYATIANEHPTQIAAIVIRRLTTGEVVLAGRRAKPTTTPPGVARLYGSNGAVLATKLGTSGLL